MSYGISATNTRGLPPTFCVLASWGALASVRHLPNRVGKRKMAVCLSDCCPASACAVNIHSNPYIRGKTLRHPGCTSPCRIPDEFGGRLPSLHSRYPKNNGCVHSFPRDGEPCLHSIRSSARCSLVRPTQDCSGSFSFSMSGRRDSL